MAAAAPEGADRREFLEAIAEDTYEMVAGLELVTPILVTSVPDLDHILWPGTEIVNISERATLREILVLVAAKLDLHSNRVAQIGTGDDHVHAGRSEHDGRDDHADLGDDADRAEPVDQIAVVAADAPDLPPLLIGKMFRELGRALLAVCPAENGGAVALAVTLPLPDWAEPDLDTPDLVTALRAQAPGRRMIATTPGWHRLRTPDDLARLDPGLEGWDNTRAFTRAG